MKSIVIFGGAGFIGKHLIRRLAKNGYKIIIPYQQSTKEEKLRFLGYTGQITPFYYNNLKDKKIRSILEKVDVCINLKTTWDSKKTSFDNYRKGRKKFRRIWMERSRKAERKCS